MSSRASACTRGCSACAYGTPGAHARGGREGRSHSRQQKGECEMIAGGECSEVKRLEATAQVAAQVAAVRDSDHARKLSDSRAATAASEDKQQVCPRVGHHELSSLISIGTLGPCFCGVSPGLFPDNFCSAMCTIAGWQGLVTHI